VFESVSGKNLQQFFTQWLYMPENPDLQISWHYNALLKQIDLSITQLTETKFSFALELYYIDDQGKKIRTKIPVNQRKIMVPIPAESRPVQIVADPDCRLLAEIAVKEIK
jgi:aminopeptidase N